jgi:hypothetical protein
MLSDWKTGAVTSTPPPPPPTGFTGVTVVAELLPVFWSFSADAVAVFVSELGAVGRTTIVITALAPGASVPIEQLTVVVAEQLPWVVDA